MPTDLQLVDGFDALRGAFYRANPQARPLKEPESATDRARPVEEILEAWLRAELDIADPNPERRRWMRSAVRAAMDAASGGDAFAVRERAGADPAEASPAEAAALRELPALAARLRERAGVAGTIRPADAGMAPADELAGWRARLPGLRGLRGWRFLAHLGRPLVAPDPAIRRFLWRLGLTDDASAITTRALTHMASELERVARLTAIEPREFGRLAAWHARQLPGFEEGGRCSVKPRCGECPFETFCSWRKYREAEASPSQDAGDAEIALLRKRVDDQQEETLADPEALALFLYSGQPGARPLQTAELLLRRFGGLRGLEMATIQELTDVKGIGEGRARQLKAAFELGRRLMSQPLRRGDSFTGSMDVWLAFRNRYRHIPQEHFITLLLDTRNRVIESSLISKGTLNGSHAHPREVFKQAIRHSASAVILMHNHPSGDPAPSPEDVAVTRQLADAGRILGIRVLDHIILGGETYYSFKDEGRM